MSYYADRYTESFSGENINAPFSDKVRVDLMTGIFSEYAFKWGGSFNLVAGIRADYYNNTEEINYLPRLNMKYNTTEQTAIRLSAGRAFRVANVLVENASLLASNRQITIGNLNPEMAWNYGTNVTYCFYLFGREGTINADAYRTVFENQVVVDIENPGALAFYNLHGESYANSMQIDLGYELFNQFDIKIAYKENDVASTYQNVSGEVKRIAPLIPKTRALVNMSYASNFEKWKFDVTWNYIGESRIPAHLVNAESEKLTFGNSDPFYLINTQITKRFRKFDVYLGGENLLSYMQENPIIDAANPDDDLFDASLIHAPVMGRTIYAGIRYKIK